MILSLETSTTVCSVALSEREEIIALREENSDYSHAENLTLFIQQVLHNAGKTLKQVHAIAISGGPGSYTGLRIGTSVAKGLCYALDKPLIAVDTLKAIASIASSLHSSLFTLHSSLLCPMINARRMEVYCALHTPDLQRVLPTQAMIIDENSFSEYFSKHDMYFFGDGAEKLKPTFASQQHAHFLDILPSAKGVALLAEQKFQKNDFQNLALYEPYYLKEPMLKQPAHK